MCEVVGGIRYDTGKATIIVHDCYWDGHNLQGCPSDDVSLCLRK